MPDERQAQPAHSIVASVGQRHSLGRARLHAAKRSTVLLSGPVRDRSMLHGTNAAAVSCQPCEIQAACVKHGAETLARHAYPRVPHRRRPQGRRRTLLRRCRGCGNRRSRRWSRLRWCCDRPHPETRLQCSSHEQEQRRHDQSIPTHVRLHAWPAGYADKRDAFAAPTERATLPTRAEQRTFGCRAGFDLPREAWPVSCSHRCCATPLSPLVCCRESMRLSSSQASCPVPEPEPKPQPQPEPQPQPQPWPWP